MSVVQQAYAEGVSTRKVDEFFQTMGLTKINKSEISRICKGLDEMVQKFLNRPLEGHYPYDLLDATYLKECQNHRIVNQAMMITIGVNEHGERELLGFSPGVSETKTF